MRALSPVLLVLISLALSACYQVAVPVVEAGVRVPGLADGGYRQDDGTLVDLRWDADAGGYRVGAGGIVRLAPAGANVYIADYQAERRIVMFARLGDAGQVIFLTLPEAAEKRLAADVGVGLRPGPIKILDGQADTVRRYFAVAAQAGDLRESARLAPMRWN